MKFDDIKKEDGMYGCNEITSTRLVVIRGNVYWINTWKSEDWNSEAQIEPADNSWVRGNFTFYKI